MIVKVVKRTHGGWNITTPMIKISDTCPICGGERGKPTSYNFCEDGEWYNVDRWDNPCGHIDKYAAVLVESRGQS